MSENKKPWPEQGGPIREMVIIQRGLLFWGSCKACEELGWAKDCPKDKEGCGTFLYQHIKRHFQTLGSGDFKKWGQR